MISYRVALIILAQITPITLPQDAPMTISWSSSTKTGSAKMNYSLDRPAIIAGDGTVGTPAEYSYSWNDPAAGYCFTVFQGGTLYLSTPTGLGTFMLTSSTADPLNLQYVSTGVQSGYGRLDWGAGLTVTITSP